MSYSIKYTNVLLQLLFIIACSPGLSQTPDDTGHRTHFIGINAALFYPNYSFHQTDGTYWTNYLYLNKINYSFDFTYHYLSRKKIQILIQTGIEETGFNKVYNYNESTEFASMIVKYHAQYWHASTVINYPFYTGVTCKQKTLQYFLGLGNESAFLSNNYYIVIYDDYKSIHREKNQDRGWNSILFYKYTNAMVAHIGFLKQLTKRLYTSMTLESRYFLLQPSAQLKKRQLSVSFIGGLYVTINNL